MSVELRRIEEYLRIKKISNRQFSLNIGKSHAFLNNALKQGSSPSVEILSLIIDNYPDINLEYIITGRGNITKDDVILQEPILAYKKNTSIDTIIDAKIDHKLKAMKEDIINIILNEK